MFLTAFRTFILLVWSGRVSLALISWGKSGNVTSAGWQVTLCDPIWHVSSRSGEASLRTAISGYFTLLYFTGW